MRTLILIFCAGLVHLAAARDFDTNEAHVTDAPVWLKQTRVEKITNRIQAKLEWTIRKINVFLHATPASYDKAQSLGPMSVAVTISSGKTSVIHLGPQITDKNFDEVFAHELVHVILYQKYRGAIPKWLEEGLANHLARSEKVDYKWLAQHPFPDDVKSLAHPFKGAMSEISYRYKASQALAEMLAKKCDLHQLIQLSVERKMEDYIKTYCEIPDVNAAFREWVRTKSG